jgi:hypothetical protein
MPFDMRHLRNPLTYSCPHDASDEDRKRANATLSKDLERAIRAVLDAHPPSVPPVAEFKAREPADGRGRFKPTDDVIGVVGGGVRGELQELRLSRSPAMWLRVIPSFDPGRNFTVSELERAVKGPPPWMPLSRDWRGFDFLRTHEGYGTYNVLQDDLATIRAIAFAFTTGELWSVDTYWLDAYRDDQGRATIPREDPRLGKHWTTTRSSSSTLVSRLRTDGSRESRI